MPQITKPEPLLVKNYLTFARASVGSRSFRKLFYRIDGKEVEILRDGDLSCAFFVSSVLVVFGLMGVLHTTVTGTVRDLRRRGWKDIPRPRTGAVIVWGPKKFRSGETHRHIGFYLGEGKVVSNSSARKSPRVHAWDFRPVEHVLFNEKLR
jgi:hypothetical protein